MYLIWDLEYKTGFLVTDVSQVADEMGIHTNTASAKFKDSNMVTIGKYLIIKDINHKKSRRGRK